MIVKVTTYQTCCDVCHKVINNTSLDNSYPCHVQELHLSIWQGGTYKAKDICSSCSTRIYSHIAMLQSSSGFVSEEKVDTNGWAVEGDSE
jgi:hypothetical protein